MAYISIRQAKFRTGESSNEGKITLGGAGGCGENPRPRSWQAAACFPEDPRGGGCLVPTPQGRGTMETAVSGSRLPSLQQHQAAAAFGRRSGLRLGPGAACQCLITGSGFLTSAGSSFTLQRGLWGQRGGGGRKAEGWPSVRLCLCHTVAFTGCVWVPGTKCLRAHTEDASLPRPGRASQGPRCTPVHEGAQTGPGTLPLRGQ